MSLRLKENIIILIIAFGFKSSLIFGLLVFTMVEAETIYKNQGFILKSDGCSIPVMDPFEKSVKKLVHYPSNLTLCPNSLHPLLGHNQTHIWIRPENYQYYQIKNESHLNCCYKSFHRPFTFSNMHRADNRIEYLDCIKIHDIIEGSNEFVKVMCYNKNEIVYDQFFIFTPKKRFTFNRENPFAISTGKLAYNVIILGLSSMSRLNFHRTMPRTYKLLKRLGCIELLGYHTAAENTYENIIPIITGMSSRELNLTCWSNGQPLFDSCSFLWERFKDVGFYTALVEDTAKSGMFNSGMFGFSGTSTDYYLHPFIHEAEMWAETNIEEPVMKIYSRHTKVMSHLRKSYNLNSSICIGNKYYFRFLLDYVESLANVLKRSKLFGIFWESSMSLDLNAPMAMDHGYEMMIKNLNSMGYLNDTILIVMSDHGTNFGNIHQTKQGRLEERLPLVSILTPHSFRKKHLLAYDNLKKNSEKLTTAFDLHETLIDLVDLDAVKDQEILLRSSQNIIYERGMSLFLPLPNARTCEDAGIKSQWCTCHKIKKINKKSKFVKQATTFLVKHLNGLVRPYPQCARLKLDEIIVAEEMWPSYRKETEWRDLRVLVKLKPGGGEYEAMLRHDGRSWSLTATVQRLNDYSDQDQDYCMHDELIKLYCHCR